MMGRLKITGRTKEIFKTSKGKYVAPAPIESKFISHPMIEMACVGGRGEPAAHVIVLLADDFKRMAKEGDKEKSDIQMEMDKLLRTINDGLVEHEKLQFLVIVNEEWFPENGFVTPTNKIKRAKIDEEEHLKHFDDWYECKNKVIWHKFRTRRMSLTNVLRASVRSLSSMESSVQRSMSFKGQQNVSKRDMKKLRLMAKCSEYRDVLHGLVNIRA